MNDVVFNKKGTVRYLAWTFGIAWAMQVIVAVLYRSGLPEVSRLLIAIMMFVPLFGARFSGQSLSDMGWKPRFKGNVRMILTAWFLPTVLTVVGAALYFAAFPGHFDLSGEFILVNAGEEALAQMEAQGLTLPLYIALSVVSGMTFAPLLNMFLALGEEVGWRGYLSAQLKARFGKRRGWLIGGVIWGMWHWPLMWLTGYEYGTNYVGFPIVGMLLFCIFTTAAGILCDWLYEKTNCIWVPSIFHGAVNAAGTLPAVICAVNTGSAVLLGPAPIGVLAGLPLIVCALTLWIKAGDRSKGR